MVERKIDIDIFSHTKKFLQRRNVGVRRYFFGGKSCQTSISMNANGKIAFFNKKNGTVGWGRGRGKADYDIYRTCSTLRRLALWSEPKLSFTTSLAHFRKLRRFYLLSPSKCLWIRLNPLINEHKKTLIFVWHISNVSDYSRCLLSNSFHMPRGSWWV